VLTIRSQETPEAVDQFSLWLQNFLAATTGGQDAARRLLARGESLSDVAEIAELSETRVRALRGEDDIR
jgi:hypothetical protein